jgi:hypothetical protein
LCQPIKAWAKNSEWQRERRRTECFGLRGKTHEENAETRRAGNGGLNITIRNGFGTEADPLITF